MNKSIAFAAATLVLAGLSHATPAEAGGGVRLQFGFPLGSFVARPCASCGSSHRYGHANHYTAERKAAARRAAMAEARAEKAAAARRTAIAEVRREALAEARRLARQRKQNEEKVAASEVTEGNAPEAAPLPERNTSRANMDVAVGEPQVILAEPAKIEQVAAAPVVSVVDVPARKPAAPLKPLDCKKFIPSAGLTITVPCQ